MALRKAEREARRAEFDAVLRSHWTVHYRTPPTVRVTVQEGRCRPRFIGTVRWVSTSGGYALLDDGGDGLLHVPLDRVRKVEVLR